MQVAFADRGPQLGHHNLCKFQGPFDSTQEDYINKALREAGLPEKWKQLVFVANPEARTYGATLPGEGWKIKPVEFPLFCARLEELLSPSLSHASLPKDRLLLTTP